MFILLENTDLVEDLGDSEKNTAKKNRKTYTLHYSGVSGICIAQCL